MAAAQLYHVATGIAELAKNTALVALGLGYRTVHDRFAPNYYEMLECYEAKVRRWQRESDYLAFRQSLTKIDRC